MKQALLEDAQHDAGALETLNRWLGTLSAEQRVVWALAYAPSTHVLSSSFGAQAAVSLHLLTRQRPDLPVVLVDTGYLFPETYLFVDELRARLALNLKVYSAAQSPAWMEAREGRLWEQGVPGIDRYNQLRKVEPMRRALDELGAGSWFAGLRRSQLQRVAYALADENFTRASWDVLDRAQDSEPRSARLLAGVTDLEIRYLDGAGEWRPDWPPASTAAPATATRLPRAIEITLDVKDWGRITRLFRVAAPQQQAAAS